MYVCLILYVTSHGTHQVRGREVPRPASIRTGVKAGQYKRTFTGSLHFYELDATTTPLRPSTECRKPSAQLCLPFAFPLSSYPIARSVILTDSVSFAPAYLPPTYPAQRRLSIPCPPSSSSPYRSTWHLRVTSGLWRHVATRRPLRLRHFIDCDHKSFYTRTSCMRPLPLPLSLEIAVEYRWGFYVSRRFIVFTTRRHIDLILISRYHANRLKYLLCLTWPIWFRIARLNY